jgi:hypothetical protein
MSLSLRLSIALLFTATACAVKTEKSADTSAAASSSPIGAATSIDTAAPPQAETPAASEKSKTPDMSVTEYGIGPIRAGMTVAQANTAMGGGFAAPRGGATGCSYAVLTKAPRGLAVMLENGRVARVEVRSGSITTADGARIGDSEARIKSLYPGAAVAPHKYLAGGHYLTVTGSDPANRIVFETDGSKVTTFRSGKIPAVENVEGCG